MATTAELLAEAKNAKHLILIGQAAVEVRDGNDGSVIRYDRSNLSKLEAYIRELEFQNGGTSPTIRPLRLTF